MVKQRKWLQAYEEEFWKRYANSNPFFKKGKEKPTYAQAVKSQQKQYHRHHHQNRPVNDYVQNVQHNQRDIHQMTTEIHKISEDIINI